MKQQRLKNSFKENKFSIYVESDCKESKETTTKNKHRDFYSPLLFLFIVGLVFVEKANGDWLMECGSCHCKWNSGKKTADCKNSSLYEVPDNLSPEVQVLDLSHNHISSMEPNIFLKSNLQNLHKLYIRNSSLQGVDPRSFSDLRILIELDLSNNQLRTLEPNQFYHLVKVRAILLNNNLLESLPDGIFQDLNYLHRIELRGNRLTHVAIRVFTNLPMLSQIYLDENRLNFLRKETFENLKRLTALSLDHNPWNCTCALQGFRDFVLQRNLYTPPTSCYFPTHLRGTLWIEDHTEAFVCKPKILYPAKAGASIRVTKENATLVCRVHASPNTQIIWNHNKQNIRVNPEYSSNRIQIHLQYDEHSKNNKNFGRNMLISRLTIFGVDKSDEGIYTCLAENAGGKDSVQMSLLVKSTTSKDMWLLEDNFTVVISVMALVLLSICFFLAMAACCFYKHFKLYKDLTHRQRHLDHFAHLDTEINNAGDVIVESSIIDSGMIVCSTNANANEAGKMTTTTSTTNTTGGYQHLHKDIAAQNHADMTVKIYSRSVLEDGTYLITNNRKEKAILAQPISRDKTNILMSNHTTTVLQKQRRPAKNNNRNIKENTDLQQECCATDFQPDLLTAFNKDVKS